MGMIELTVKLLMKQSKKAPFVNRHLVTIGRQGICFPTSDLVKWAQQSDFNLDDTQLIASFRENRFPTDEEFFRSLGFASVDSIDCSEYENASIICNLNSDIPEELYNRFDVVYDGGSTEHMFNVPKAFENYNKMLKVGGMVIHSLPSTGCLDHGFYMFSPTLFYDYYTQNQWDIVDFYMLNIPCNTFSNWNIYEYGEPGPMLEDVDFKERWTIFFIARKRAESAYGLNIEQHFFKKLWQNKQYETASIVSAPADTILPGLLRRAYSMLPEKFRIKVRNELFGNKLISALTKKPIPFRKVDLIH
ncbi:MAG: class I SAM-dependent methyltransferase [Geobacteraceae bacterium]|nr:class I SAM-dependent methyltransferase [Geobacteraceae bacterium]